MGAEVYIGKPCRQCGNRERYFSNATCVHCNVERNRKWRQDHPDQAARHRRNAKMKAKFGITLDQYEQTLAAQDGHCACCEQSSGLRPFGETLLCEGCHKTATALKKAPALGTLLLLAGFELTPTDDAS